ncbi:DNA gyrase subunit A [Myxococcota bacterium]|nr:DNA gyrase subunit A [Myxococcota bacterium]
MSDPTLPPDEFAKTLLPIDIEDEMRSSYLDYSMSVIIGRALPDVRDGLKPVHRRILFAMWQEGLRANKKHSKCAGVVGEVLKKYHPHGDSAVYDALVRLAQPWNMRHPLVDGQGNFGSVDGDPAAAYRYTEARMTRLAETLLGDDIKKQTVNFVPNFDGQVEEPVVLPSAYPNLLVNGSDGIAVGMATKIPPHNLAEIIDATVALIDDPDIDVQGLMAHVPGPDFPTAGTIYGRRGIYEAYSTGRGRVVVRGNTFFEDMDNGKTRIVIDELPFQVNKARLVEEIAELVKARKIDGITALRDESDRTGMRVVVELRRDVVPEIVLNHLYKHTALQSTFGVILLAIVHNRPMVLTLKEMLQHYVQHRRDVVVRRTRFDLREALARLHIVEGLLKALDHIDRIIALIRASATDEAARDALMAEFDFSELQAQAILEMQLRRLTGLSRQKLMDEQAELRARVEEYRAILGSEARLMAVIKAELVEVKEKYADARRTRIKEDAGEMSVQDLIQAEDAVITLSLAGYIKRTSQDEYQEQRRGGFGKKGMNTRAEDSIKDIFIANTHSTLLVFTTHGWMFGVPAWQVPNAGRTARGTPLVNLVNLEADDQIAAVLSIDEFSDDLDLVFCSRQGLVKRTRLSDYKNLRSNGLRAYDCAEGDALLSVVKAGTDQEILIATHEGRCVRFPGPEVRHMGRVARGVRGMKLREGDAIATLLVLEPGDEKLLLTVSEKGFGKRTSLSGYRLQGRGGLGIINMLVDERNGPVVGSVQVADGDRVMLITDNGRVIKIPVENIRVSGRNTKGVTLMRVEEGERVVGLARIPEEEALDEELDEVPVSDEPAEAEEGPEADLDADGDGDEPGEDEA